MPTVLCYVLCLMFVSGFESHSLRHIIGTKAVALDSDPLSGMSFLLGVSDMQFCRVSVRSVKAKTD
jgi:hypothetical protein